MAVGSRLLLIERIIDPQAMRPDVVRTDLHALVITGGVERTSQQFRYLLKSAGSTALLEALPDQAL